MTEQGFIQQAEGLKGWFYRIVWLYLDSEAYAVGAVDGAAHQGFLHYRCLCQPKHFATWMTHILINARSAELRYRKRRLVAAELPETVAEAFDTLPLWEAVVHLPRELRVVVVLRHLQGLTLAETVQTLDIPSGTVSTRRYEALSLLKPRLTKEVRVMDYMEEYKALRDAPEELPPALEGTVAHVRIRARRWRLWRRASAPTGSVATVFAAFALLVSLSILFALACGKVPVLKELAAAVAFSPNPKAAVGNDFIQYIGQSQIDNDVTIAVKCIIVDEERVNIFFTLGSEVYTYLNNTPDLSLEDGSGAPAPVQYSSPNELKGGGLYQITVGSTDGDVLSALRLDYRMDDYATRDGGASEHAHFDTPCPMPATPAAEFSLLLRFDPHFLQQGETIQLNQWLELDSQRLYVKNMEICPIHVRPNLEDDEGNSAWLKDLGFCLEDEKGGRYKKISNGITASGSTDSPFMPSHRLESSYFGDAEHLKLYITGVEWLDKDLEYMTVNLNTLEAHPQPPQIIFLEMEEHSDDRVLVCCTLGSTAVLTQSLYTPDGEGRPAGGRGFTIATKTLESDDFLALEGLIDQTIHLGNYH